ncbi:MAG: hypothetical protein CUN56_11415 [Phototrophicales bacterium]|nr:MAG: hypothetical protein CUN56_11415 [Phototrophicales bacterium]RMG78003.1 MAG: hypothetical protein D6711_00140 [Chloroflexota bacterium]
MFPQDENPIARLAAIVGISIMLAVLGITLFGIFTNSTNTFESPYLRLNYPDGWREMNTDLITDCEDIECILVLQQIAPPNATLMISRLQMLERQTPEQLALRSQELQQGEVIGTFDLTLAGQSAFGLDVLVSGRRCDTIIRQIYAIRDTTAYQILVIVPCQDDFASILGAVQDMLDSLQLFSGQAI